MVLSTQDKDGYTVSPILHQASYKFYSLYRPTKRIFFLDCFFFDESEILLLKQTNKYNAKRTERIFFLDCLINNHFFTFWQFNDMINVPFSSEAFVASLLAFVLDTTLHRKDNQTRKDRGMHWWDRFRSFKTDTRSEEFYSLPFNLNKFFPSVWSLGHVVLRLCNQVMLLQYLLVGITVCNMSHHFSLLSSAV